MTRDVWDLLVIGGGVNGTSIARDAAGRELRVLLCERDDLAQHTSSASTKLIHGGLRYLEQYEFRLVRESLKERTIMLESAPHIIWPMEFILPHNKYLRPAWMLRLGLFFYDHLAGRDSLANSKTVKLRQGRFENILKPSFKTGFSYSDCWVDDARLVVGYAKDAAHKGADIRTCTEVKSLKFSQDCFEVVLQSKNGETCVEKARAVVNSAGPWVDKILTDRLADSQQRSNRSTLRLVKGSHIVTQKLFEGEHAYIFQNSDQRIIFAIPYEGDYTLIGTTDVAYDFSDGDVAISQSEITYLCDAVSEYLQKDVSPSDVVHTYAGVRPLYDDRADEASEVTRDYVLETELFPRDREDQSLGAPMVNVYGGKITTARKLAEQVVDGLSKHFDMDLKPWTKTAHMPGGNLHGLSFEEFVSRQMQTYAWLDENLCRRYARAYGTDMDALLKNCHSADDLGEYFGAGLYGFEVAYLVENEWARRPQDILWRRTKQGLHMTTEEINQFVTWFDTQYSNT